MTATHKDKKNWMGSLLEKRPSLPETQYFLFYTQRQGYCIQLNKPSGLLNIDKHECMVYGMRLNQEGRFSQYQQEWYLQVSYICMEEKVTVDNFCTINIHSQTRTKALSYSSGHKAMAFDTAVCMSTTHIHSGPHPLNHRFSLHSSHLL